MEKFNAHNATRALLAGAAGAGATLALAESANAQASVPAEVQAGIDEGTAVLGAANGLVAAGLTLGVLVVGAGVAMKVLKRASSRA